MTQVGMEVELGTLLLSNDKNSFTKYDYCQKCIKLFFVFKLQV